MVRAQYTAGSIQGTEVPGYLQEKGVAPDSKTDTYVAIRLELNNWRWAGVPFFLRTGKRLPKRATEIAIQFHRPPTELFEPEVDGQSAANQLVLRIQPNEGASLTFEAKIPGSRRRLAGSADGFPLRHRLRRPAAGSLRAPAPGRDARRPDALHPHRRGRERLAVHHVDPRRLAAARRAAARQVCRRQLGARGGRRLDRRDGLAGGGSETGDSSRQNSSIGDVRRPVTCPTRRPTRFSKARGSPSIFPKIETELAKLWGPAAEQIGGPELENPHVTRIVLANLVVECLDGDGESLGPVLETVIARFPCRAIVVRGVRRPGAPDQRRGVGALPPARTRACRRSAPSGSCCEPGPKAVDLIPGAVRPLLEADLPMVLWWTGDPRKHEQLFRDLADECSRLVLDLPDPAAEAGALRLGLDPAFCPCSRDSAWFGLTRWRELVAQFFDPPCNAESLRRIESVHIEALSPDPTRPPRMAIWLAAWLAGQLGWKPQGQPVNAAGDSESVLAAHIRRPGGRGRRRDRHPADALGLAGLAATGGGDRSRPGRRKGSRRSGSAVPRPTRRPFSSRPKRSIRASCRA